MAKSAIELSRIIWFYLLFLWASFGYATELSFAEGIETIPFKAIVYVFGMSVLGGMAATLPKLVNNPAQIQNKTLEVVKDVVCSFVAGLIVFLVAIWQEWTWSLTCLLVLLGGAGNAKFIDLVLNNGFFPRVAQAFGKVPDYGVPPAPKHTSTTTEETPQ